MIEQANPDDLPGVRHAAREAQILGTRGRISTRMGVKEDQKAGIAEQALLENLSRLDRSAIESAAKQLVVGHQTVSAVEKECPHHLLARPGVAQPKVSGNGCRLTQRLSIRQIGASQAPPQLDGRNQTADLGITETVTAKSTGAAEEQAPETSASLEQPTSRLQGRRAARPGPQDHRHQLGIGQGGRAMTKQSLSRAFIRRL